MDCKYCIGEEVEGIGIYKSRYEDGYILEFEDGFDFADGEPSYATIVIKYCPFCGRKLED